MKPITFSKAVEGYDLYARARRLSIHTLEDYYTTFTKFLDFLDGDPPIAEITPQQVESFLANQNVSNKTLYNYHTGLAALWTWAHKQDLVSKHIVQQVDRPKPQRRAIEPYTEKDIRAMLQALGRSRLYTRPRKRSSQHSTQYADRHRAIILLLLDTGIRSSEICQLRIHQVDLRNRTIKVLGKGNKERQIPISSRTSQSLWKYLATRKDDDMGDHLFITSTGRGLDSGQLIRILRRIGARAGVDHVTTHRFRHTFAINFLRNGGDVYSLQMLLGHTSLEMVRRYLAIAQADVQRAHQQASPVDNWRL